MSFRHKARSYAILLFRRLEKQQKKIFFFEFFADVNTVVNLDPSIARLCRAF